jgi:N-acetylglucosamine-6-phosphate deacetylase
MTNILRAYIGAEVFDGTDLHKDKALLVQDGMVAGIVDDKDVPADAQLTHLAAGTLAPGFVDLQVNGGGGVMFGDDPSLTTLKRMARAHEALGATSTLPTLITDTPEITSAAIAAVGAAVAQGVAGIIGLHLEGPHLNPARKGAHDEALIRPMGDDDLGELCAAARALPVLKVTLAPEVVTPDQIRALAGVGAVVSLGHSEARFDQCVAAMQAGASSVTHLFNAMRGLGSREPGVAGAGLGLGGLSAGVIGDMIHVHPETLRLALAAKRGPGRIFLVSDAMAVAGTQLQSFTLRGREITRRDGRLTLADGTLAGADLDLATAVRNLNSIGAPVSEALAMATSRPAAVVAGGGNPGHLRPGGVADFVHLDADLRLTGVWRAGASLAAEQGPEPTLRGR